MLFELKLRLTAPFLGDKRTNEGVRRFARHRSDDGELELDPAQWTWACDEAIKALRLKNVTSDGIRFPASIDAPSIILHTRRWHNRAKQRKSERFECIQKGTILTSEILLLDKMDPHEAHDARSPTAEEFVDIMSFIGRMIGLSPWGSKFGLGRFTVESFEPK